MVVVPGIASPAAVLPGTRKFWTLDPCGEGRPTRMMQQTINARPATSGKVILLDWEGIEDSLGMGVAEAEEDRVLWCVGARLKGEGCSLLGGVGW